MSDPLGLFPRQKHIQLGPFTSPGVAIVRGAGSPRNWDIRQGWGFSGAVVVFTGKGLSKFEVDILLWEPEHFLQWKLFAQILKPPIRGIGPTGAGVSALGITHPVLNGAPLNINEVVVEDVSQPVQSDTGLWTYTIKFIEYRKPIPAIARPIAAIPAAPAAAVAPPDENEKVMLQLSAQITALGG